MEVALCYVSSTPRNTYRCNTYHLSFQDWFAAEKIGSPPEVIVNPRFNGNLWRCLSFVKCSLNQTKCQSTLYQTVKPMCYGLCILWRGKLVHQVPRELSTALMRHGVHRGLHHSVSRRRRVTGCERLHAFHVGVVLLQVDFEVSVMNYLMESLSHPRKQTCDCGIYYTSVFIVGRRNKWSLLSIAQLKEVHVSAIAAFQSLSPLLGSKALTINSVESACQQKRCKTW